MNSIAVCPSISKRDLSPNTPLKALTSDIKSDTESLVTNKKFNNYVAKISKGESNMFELCRQLRGKSEPFLEYLIQISESVEVSEFKDSCLCHYSSGHSLTLKIPHQDTNLELVFFVRKNVGNRMNLCLAPFLDDGSFCSIPISDISRDILIEKTNKKS